ncbi:LPD28 domain-containing protein, partial [Gordonibacter sp.]|uniref:LPD28 domain-containing protein n=1 Tax=Gordonibacter sp. TaxID=1968902 RepID=UPI002FC78DD4
DDFVGGSENGYHLSFDGLRLMEDGKDRVYDKRLQTDKFAYFASEDYDVMFSVASDGAIDEFVADGFFADEGLLDSLKAITMRTGGTRAVFMDEFTRRYLPTMTRDYEWIAPGKDAAKIAYYDVETQGTRALYTERTVSPESIPKALHVYEIDSDPANPRGKQKLSKHAYVNFTGTLITERPLDLGELGYAYLDPKDVSLHSDTPIKLKDFAREVGVRIKPPKDRDR